MIEKYEYATKYVFRERGVTPCVTLESKIWSSLLPFYLRRGSGL